MMPLSQMQAAFEAAYPAASRARAGDTYGGAFGSMFIVWQQAVASCAPAVADQVGLVAKAITTDEAREYLAEFMLNHFSDVTFKRYIMNEQPDGLAGDFAWQMATALRRIAATRTAAPVQAAPEGWKLVPVKPTGVMKDAGSFSGLPISIASPWIAAKVYEAMVDIAPAPRSSDMKHDSIMRGYAVACKFGVLEGMAFKLVDEMIVALAAPRGAS